MNRQSFARQEILLFIYHITTRAAWEAARQAGQYTAPSLAQEGFIHASTLAQVVDTANRFYAGQPGLVLLAIDVAAVAPPVRFDPVTTHGAEQRFPHVYGPLNLDAVAQVIDFEPGADGTFSLPAALARA
jgi:uncharacterized protein (DUF952 family)